MADPEASLICMNPLHKTLQEERDQAVVMWRHGDGEIEALENEVARLLATLKQIAEHPTRVLNPDGKDQAAHEMALIAQNALRKGNRR